MDEHIINSIIGHNSKFSGDIEIDGLLRIDGDCSGSIKIKGKVLLGSQGRAECVIDAHTVVVGGIFKGTIYASEKVVLLSSAVVMGSIFSPRLVVEEGVILDGALLVPGAKNEERTDADDASEAHEQKAFRRTSSKTTRSIFSATRSGNKQKAD